jgi:plasmid stabilization system protein ParE
VILRADLWIRPEAVEEIKAAREWYHSQNPAAALLFEHELEHALRILLTVPRAGRSLPRLRARTIAMYRFPFVIAYRLHRKVAGRDQIELVALAHGSREPGYWRRRGK